MAGLDNIYDHSTAKLKNNLTDVLKFLHFRNNGLLAEPISVEQMVEDEERKGSGVLHKYKAIAITFL